MKKYEKGPMDSREEREEELEKEREWLKSEFGISYDLSKILQEKLEEWDENKKPKSIDVLENEIHKLRSELRQLSLELEPLKQNAENLEEEERDKFFKLMSRSDRIRYEIKDHRNEVRRIQKWEEFKSLIQGRCPKCGSRKYRYITIPEDS